MRASLQNLGSTSMINEVREKVGVPTTHCVDPFYLRMTLATTTESIIAGNTSTPFFKDVQPL